MRRAFSFDDVSTEVEVSADEGAPPVRLAIFGDARGRLPALAAVLRDRRSEQVDHACCSGAVVGYAPFAHSLERAAP